MKVIHSYTAALVDELELKAGQDIIVLKCFDDGWGLGMLPETGAQGAFPLVCVLAAVPSLSSSLPPAGANSHPPSSVPLSAAHAGAYPNLSFGSNLPMRGDQERLSAMMRRSGIVEVGSAGVPLQRSSSKRR
ncbi:hypothetical protein BC829DRAFT_106079 [Chytridium lagenaria]|nr:hypothetical protein BC829DRAFT_106079 [Chytridium lagenaria]